jgi:membrane protein YdbS with pleckstrin-like domain
VASSMVAIAAAVLILLIFPIPALIRALTTCYDFRDGYLYATKGGVLFRSEKSYELTHLLDTTIARGPLDFLTNNGSLHLHFEKHGTVVLRGLAPMSELKKIRDDLNNFSRLLRSHPVLKGLIA